MPAPTIARARLTEFAPPPSSFTQSQPASLTILIAVVTACSSETSYDPNGRSPISSGVRRPRRAARVRTSMSFSSTGVVALKPSTVVAAESPTRTRSTPADSAARALG